MLLPGRNTSCASLPLPAPRWAARTPRPPDIELGGDPANQPAGTAKQVCEFLVRAGRVLDDQVADRLVHSRRAHPFHETNLNHFGDRSFDLAVSTHNYPSLKEGSKN